MTDQTEDEPYDVINILNLCILYVGDLLLRSFNS